MKSITFVLVLATVLIAGTCITSCDSPAKKREKENVQTETEFHVQKIATTEEWDVFKNEQELKIKEIELRIAELKEKILKPESGQKIDSIRLEKIVELEQKINIQKAMIKSYESNQTDWETFKQEFIHNMEETGNEFKDLTIDNKN